MCYLLSLLSFMKINVLTSHCSHQPVCLDSSNNSILFVLSGVNFPIFWDGGNRPVWASSIEQVTRRSTWSDGLQNHSSHSTATGIGGW